MVPLMTAVLWQCDELGGGGVGMESFIEGPVASEQVRGLMKGCVGHG